MHAVLGVPVQLDRRRLKEHTMLGRANAKAPGVEFGRKHKHEGGRLRSLEAWLLIVGSAGRLRTPFDGRVRRSVFLGRCFRRESREIVIRHCFIESAIHVDHSRNDRWASAL